MRSSPWKARAQRRALLLLMGAAALSRSAGAAPPPEPDRSDASLTSHVEVTLVLIDTVVTDKKGNPVPGLGLEDFDLIVDNVRSPINSIERTCGAPAPSPAGGSGGGAPVAASAPTARPAAHYILFFDMSHLKAGARTDSLRAALQYVDTMMEANDLVMVLAFRKGLRIMRSFTADRSALHDELKSIQADNSLTDSTPFEEENTLERLGLESVRAKRAGFRALEDIPGPLVSQCHAEARLAEIEATRAIRAMGNAMPAFSSIPGRKALIFFSETLRSDPGLPIYEACKVPLFDRPSLGLTIQPEIADLVKRANLAGVSFYAVHSGGLAAGPTASVMRSAVDFQTGLATDTGGKAFILMNDPLKVFEQAKRDLSCYYVLSFRPPEGFRSGTHQVTVSTRNRRLTVRHRKSFFTQTSVEAGNDQMLAVLSSPGLYRDLKVEAHGYTLADTKGRKRQFLLKASVALQDLALVPSSESTVSGSVLLRGGIVSNGTLQCEFAETIRFERARRQEGANGEAGVESLCALEEGEHEIVVAGRDENGGALGAFWGKIQVKPVEARGGGGALLWSHAGEDVWRRHEGAAWLPSGQGAGEGGGREPYFIRHGLSIRRDEPGALTFVACRDATERGSRAPGEASVTLEGPTSLELPAREMSTADEGTCRNFRAEIPPRTLAAGIYRVTPQAPRLWTSAAGSVTMTVLESGAPASPATSP